ncbi:acetyl-coenzyme A synthetase N-terminal domain-containing protein, partial [Kocuria sp.]
MASDATPVETKTFAPSAEFTAQANATAELYRQAEAEGTEFWARQARELLSWDKEFTEVLDWSNPPFAKWFQDGTLNACYNAVDRHVEAG